MNTYKCRGFGAVKAETIHAAAAEFARRQARREFGPRGIATDPVLQSWSQDGTRGEYASFIGRKTGQRETTGRNFRFTVTV